MLSCNVFKNRFKKKTDLSLILNNNNSFVHIYMNLYYT